MQHYIQRKRQEEGFTLIELLIVIVVIGILAGIVLFGTSTFRTDSVQACNNANTRIVASATEAYIAKNGAPPANTAALVPDYMKSLPNCGS
jgi:prepilin-type N-terminal cleavage/methylation domain-containing protein